MIPRCTRAEIDSGALAGNLAEAKRRCGGRKVCAVVKADGYGHGALRAARAFAAAGADMLGVALLEEALELREAGIDAPILVLGHCDPANAPVSVANRITHAVFEPDLARALSEEGIRRGVRVPVHVKVDTGMNRLGLLPAAVPAFARLAAGLGGLRIEGMFSHFADADVPGSDFARVQLSRFMDAVRAFSEYAPRPEMLHMAASGALLNFRESWLDMVRPGVLLYGLSPSPAIPLPAGFKPALRLVTRITMLKTVSAGESVSYGRTFFAARESRIAVLPIGYGDGYPRALSNRAAVFLRGARAPQVGRVCMDNLMIDVTDIPDAREGDEVLVLGGPELPVSEIAALLGTIDYEVACGLGKRIPRADRSGPGQPCGPGGSA